MMLSYSRDPFCCFTTSQDLATFFDCHRRAFAHFGGVPMTIVYDRTKTVVRRHVAPGRGGAAASGSGRVRRALRLRHRRAGRLPADRQGPGRAAGRHRPRPCPGRAGLLLPRGDGRRVRGLGAACGGPGPPHPRRGHRRAGGPGPRRAATAARPGRMWSPSGICGMSARTAWSPSPATSTRCRPARSAPASWSRSGRPSRQITHPRHRRPTPDGATLLATHPRAVGRGARVVDESHWDGLPDGHDPRRHHRRRPPVRSRHRRPDRHASGRDRCRPCSTGPPPPRSPSAAGRCRSMTRSPGPARSPTDHTTKDVSSERAGHQPHPRQRRQARPASPGRDAATSSPAGPTTEAWATWTSSTWSWKRNSAVRDDRRFRAGLRLSKLPHHKTLDDYDFTFQPDLDPRKVRDLATLAFVQAKANVALLGPPGVGKTHIAVALAVAACRAGFSVYFTTLDDMVRHLTPPTRPAGWPASCRPTYAPPSWSSTKSATSPSNEPRPTSSSK